MRTAYDPKFELATDANGRKVYRSVTSTVPTEIPAPGLPFSINFLVEPGMEHLAIEGCHGLPSGVATARATPDVSISSGRAVVTCVMATFGMVRRL